MLPEEVDNKFQKYVIGFRKQKKYLLSHIGNMDETPVTFDMIGNKTITGPALAVWPPLFITNIKRDNLDQGWRTSGTRAISGTQHNILDTPTIKMICILFQNNKVQYEVLRTNAAGSTLVYYCPALVTSWTRAACDVKFV
ncbi:hypothetical protein TNCV_3562801 [Trichonephila clavipes]|nr:hypothetical protein TNCV_3562801 [Trichonephila clavipes]